MKLTAVVWLDHPADILGHRAANVYDLLWVLARPVMPSGLVAHEAVVAAVDGTRRFWRWR